MYISKKKTLTNVFAIMTFVSFSSKKVVICAMKNYNFVMIIWKIFIFY